MNVYNIYAYIRCLHYYYYFLINSVNINDKIIKDCCDTKGCYVCGNPPECRNYDPQSPARWW